MNKEQEFLANLHSAMTHFKIVQEAAKAGNWQHVEDALAYSVPYLSKAADLFTEIRGIKSYRSIDEKGLLDMYNN